MWIYVDIRETHLLILQLKQIMNCVLGKILQKIKVLLKHPGKQISKRKIRKVPINTLVIN